MTTFRWLSSLGGSSVAVVGSFNGWGAPLQLAKTASGDFVRSVALQPGPTQFKFLVDGKYMVSPSFPQVITHGGNCNNELVVAPTAEFRWPTHALGGSEVMVTGEWNAWGELLPLQLDPTGEWHVLCACLPPGTHAYQFLVDGQWQLSPADPTAHTEDGNLANRCGWVGG